MNNRNTFSGLQKSRLHLSLSNYGDSAEILRDAETELSANVLLSTGQIALTPKYLIVFSALSPKIIPLESVLWVFDLQHMRYDLKEHREKMVWTLRIITIAGDLFRLKFRKKADMDRIMEVLIDRYPNFFYGYSEEHDHMVHYILDENEKELRKKRKSNRQRRF